MADKGKGSTRNVRIKEVEEYPPSPRLENETSMTQSEIDAVLEKGIESVRAGRTYTLDEVDAELKKKSGI